MRKRTIKFCFDTVLWGVVMLLPLILYFAFVIFYLHGSRELGGIFTEFDGDLSFANVMNTFFDYFTIQPINEQGILFSAFSSLFNGEYLGYIDGSTNSMILWFACYLILVELLHLCVDFILFLPRVCRKFFDKFHSEE